MANQVGTKKLYHAPVVKPGGCLVNLNNRRRRTLFVGLPPPQDSLGRGIAQACQPQEEPQVRDI
ncbi:MAG: hypothetical protein HC913_10365 [Microscillaceae bacterium]|nr:hypothetical protein [Microscillaceae bacterium]